MRQVTHRLTVKTPGRGLHDISAEVEVWIEQQGIGEGLLTLFIQHTSASLTIQENADRDVLRDLDDYFTHLVPDDAKLYRHTAEGPDDMPAHARSAVTKTWGPGREFTFSSTAISHTRATSSSTLRASDAVWRGVKAVALGCC